MPAFCFLKRWVLTSTHLPHRITRRVQEGAGLPSGWLYPSSVSSAVEEELPNSSIVQSEITLTFSQLK